MEVLFRTRHGSHLYGLAHAESDEDWFTVVAKKDGTTAHTRKKYATHSVVDGLDSVVVDFGTWLVGCEKGVPQFLEAMFSQQPEVDRIANFRASFRVGTGVYQTYLRTIKSFAMEDTFKHKRHALRLALNMNSIRGTGRFNPTLTPSDVYYTSTHAYWSPEAVYREAKHVAWFTPRGYLTGR